MATFLTAIGVYVLVVVALALIIKFAIRVLN